MKIYAVSLLFGGPDEQLRGLFSTREKADAYVEELKKDSSYQTDVVEWELDELCGHRVRPMFACSVNVDGEIESEWSYELLAGDDEPDTTDSFGYTFTGRSIKSPERAQELAVESVRALLNHSAQFTQKENGPGEESASC